LTITSVVRQNVDSVLVSDGDGEVALPSFVCLSRAIWISDSKMGLSLLRTQTVVKTAILLNHMPRYQPGEEAVVVVVLVSVELPMAPRLEGNWKKPSANLPFLETSLSSTVRAWPAARVSPFAAAVEEGRHGQIRDHMQMQGGCVHVGDLSSAVQRRSGLARIRTQQLGPHDGQRLGRDEKFLRKLDDGGQRRKLDDGGGQPSRSGCGCCRVSE
jgi:hypothetical protein